MSNPLADYLSELAFRSNTNLRPKGAIIQYTDEMLDEYIKCKNDPVYFITTYIMVVHPDRGIVPMVLYDYQKNMVNAYHNNRRVIFLTSRQQGKCLSINSNIKIKQKSTGKIFEFTIGEFYEWQRFKEYAEIEDLQKMRESISSTG